MELMPNMTIEQKIGVWMMFGGAVAMQIQLLQLLRKYNKLVDEYNTQLEKRRVMHAQIVYMLATLEQRGFNLNELFDEFDLIALRNLAQSEAE